jgi:hypothetical protein
MYSLIMMDGLWSVIGLVLGAAVIFLVMKSQVAKAEGEASGIYWRHYQANAQFVLAQVVSRRSKSS